MSSHQLDLSGARPLTTTVNDPARTFVSTHAKQGDDLNLNIGGCREIRISLPASTRLQVRRYMRRTARQTENHVYVRDPETNEILYEEKPDELLVLVIPGGLQAFGRVSRLPDESEEEVSELTPHTMTTVRRMDGLHMHESGELLHELELGEAAAWVPPHFPPGAEPRMELEDKSGAS